MNPRLRAALVFTALSLVAAAYRLPRLADRPMHADEAIHADKLGDLLEKGSYAYSSVDFHGPTLYYLSLAAVRAQGITHYADLTEISLRIIPALLGILLVAAHFLLIPYLGLPSAACAALFAAVSPAMVYYSRYFIHETLFVALTFALLLALFAYCAQNTPARALVAGALLGLLYATKETTILPAACMLLAGAVEWRRALRARHLALAAAAALAVAALFLSSFFSHPRGMLDSLLAYRTYFERGAGLQTLHVHPWHFYFDRLLYFHAAGAPVWSEALIASLALAGLYTAARRPGVPRFLALYTLLLTALYCAIPYKAPWNLLGFLHGMILLAGMGLVWLVERTRRMAPRLALVALVGVGVAHLGIQARAASLGYAADPRNPWVYAHTGTDIFTITRKLEAAAAAHPAGHALPIQIVTRENLWPLPWYLRRFPNARWWTGISDTVPSAPVILATPDMEPALLHKLYDLPPPGQREMYLNLFDRYIELRPRVEVRGYVAKSLWDEVR